MATLSAADQQNLSADQQKQILALKDAWAAADTQEEKNSINQQAEAIRAQAGYSGGSDGSGYVPLSNQNASGGQSATAASQTLSASDQALSAEQQQQIAVLKNQWAQAQAANDQAAMNRAHEQAEAIRRQAGYTGGADGSGSTRVGGRSAAEVQQWVDDYKDMFLSPVDGWKNGFSGDMNQRSMANYIRQQMQANSEAWASADADTRSYLHEQNLLLADILADAVGGAQSYFNEELGRWETDNANLGYGYDTGQFNDPSWYKDYYGMTDEQVEAYKSDTSRYSNYVDQRTIRNWIDDSSGYTGVYAQFVNGPYGQLIAGDNRIPRSVYIDLQGDGEGWENFAPIRDGNGNIIPQSPYLKNNNDITDYTKSHAAYVDENGVIQPGTVRRSYGGSGTAHNTVSADDINTYLEAASSGNGQEPGDAQMQGNAASAGSAAGTIENTGTTTGNNAGTAGSASGTSDFSSILQSIQWPSLENADSLEDYLKAMYAANLQANLAALEAEYRQNTAELDRTGEKTDASYDEQKRQASGTAAQRAANFREIANAQGLNSGAFGQAALTQNNQLQSDLNTLSAAQAQAQADIAQERYLLGQQYQNAILKAQADNNYELARALYEEAVRTDGMLTEEETGTANWSKYSLAELENMASQRNVLNFDLVNGNRNSSSSNNNSYYVEEPDPDPFELTAAEKKEVDSVVDDVVYMIQNHNLLYAKDVESYLKNKGKSDAVVNEVLNQLGGSVIVD